VISNKVEVQQLREKNTLNRSQKQYYNDIKDHNNIQIPAQKDESDYTLDPLLEQQQAVVLALIDTIVNFLNNDTKYKPLQAIVMGCGGTGKSFIINTIISIVQK
jgi:phage/plasmid-associated DNA primase